MDACIFFENIIPKLELDLIKIYTNFLSSHSHALFISCSTFRNHTYDSSYKTNVRLSENRVQEMNKEPFFLYALDRINNCLIRMRVQFVYIYENLTPDLKKILPTEFHNFIGIAYYKINSFEVLPYECGNQIVNSNTGKCILTARQINQCAPWNVSVYNQGAFAEFLLSLPINISVSKYPEEEGYCVYRYYQPDLNMSYIGETNNINQRIKHHESESSWNSATEKDKLLYLAFKSIGRDKFQFEILHKNIETELEARQLEAQEIENYNAYYPFGFNLRNEKKYLN